MTSVSRCKHAKRIGLTFFVYLTVRHQKSSTRKEEAQLSDGQPFHVGETEGGAGGRRDTRRRGPVPANGATAGVPRGVQKPDGRYRVPAQRSTTLQFKPADYFV